jgi:hypothetical protein
MTTDRVKTAAPQLFDANLYDVSGPVRINFSRSSFAGRPQLSYQDTEFDLSFEGEELEIVSTQIGDLVTVTVQSIPDALDRRITLLVPTIRLAAGEQAEFETVLLETLDRSGAFVPAPGPAGVLQCYRTHQLQATAQHVEF